MAMVDLSVQGWPSDSGMQVAHCFSSYEGGLLGAIHTAHTVSETWLPQGPCCLWQWPRGGQSHEWPWPVICKCQPVGKQNVEMLGMGIQAGVTEIMLLTNSDADGMIGLNNSSKFGVRNNKIAKCLCRQSIFRVCVSIPLQARNGLVQQQVLGIRKPF